MDFETIHPFCDGNGRIGRVLINFQLYVFGFPNIIIRDKEKKGYYKSFNTYREHNDPKQFQTILALALLESLHRRLAYLQGYQIIKLAEFAKNQDRSINTLLNAARRQTLPAFREKGIWKIGIKHGKCHMSGSDPFN